jgi:DNA (cytosine-5)-methyltransferase 1
MKPILRCADFFCGSGGSSTGIRAAVESLGYHLDLTAVNHDARAILTHSANHPDGVHYIMDVDALAPSKLGTLDLFWASPSCVTHSFARGSRPIEDQLRASAWSVINVAERVRPTRIIVENVEPFTQWGPLNDNGRPIPSLKGATFNAWVGALRALAYDVEWRVINSANFGVAQTRQRLFLQARRDGQPIVWPEPTHSKDGTTKPRWVGAGTILDWSIPMQSLLKRGEPFSEATMLRIADGLRRFNPALAEPFIVVFRRHATARSLHDPLPTVTTGGEKGGNHFMLVKPFILGQHGGSVARGLESPIPTVATDGAIRLFKPTIETPTEAPAYLPRVQIDGTEYAIDLLYRYLSAGELSRAMGFPADYVYPVPQGAAKKQAGNAVCPPVAEALVRAAFHDLTATPLPLAA